MDLPESQCSQISENHFSSYRLRKKAPHHKLNLQCVYSSGLEMFYISTQQYDRGQGRKLLGNQVRWGGNEKGMWSQLLSATGEFRADGWCDQVWHYTKVGLAGGEQQWGSADKRQGLNRVEAGPGKIIKFYMQYGRRGGQNIWQMISEDQLSEMGCETWPMKHGIMGANVNWKRGQGVQWRTKESAYFQILKWGSRYTIRMKRYGWQLGPWSRLIIQGSQEADIGE